MRAPSPTCSHPPISPPHREHRHSADLRAQCEVLGCAGQAGGHQGPIEETVILKLLVDHLWGQGNYSPKCPPPEVGIFQPFVVVVGVCREGL